YPFRVQAHAWRATLATDGSPEIWTRHGGHPQAGRDPTADPARRGHRARPLLQHGPGEPHRDGVHPGLHLRAAPAAQGQGPLADHHQPQAHEAADAGDAGQPRQVRVEVRGDRAAGERQPGPLMRAFLAVLVLALPAAAPAEDVNLESSDCNAHGVALYPPPSSVIPTDARLFLEGVGVEVRRVQALEGDAILARAGDDAVPFQVQFAWRSGMNRVAMLLKPRALLKANRTYALNLRAKLPGFHFLDGSDGEPAYLTGKGPDDQKPEWVSAPSVSEGIYRKWDEKTFTRFLRFNVKLNEVSPAYLVLSLQRARGSVVKQTYFLPV